MPSCSSCSSSQSTSAYIQQQLQARLDPTQARNVAQAANKGDGASQIPTVQPTVNSQGEALGKLVNATA